MKSGAADVDMDMQLALDLDLSAVTGARYHAARKFLIDEATRWSLTGTSQVSYCMVDAASAG